MVESHPKFDARVHIYALDPKPMVDKYDGHPMPGSVPVTQRHVGNFPQGFSHLALVQTADLLESGTAKRTRAWSPVWRRAAPVNHL